MKMNSKSLKQRCKISMNTKDDSFVGIRIETDDIYISFPMGYDIGQADDRELRKEILSLMNVLQRFNSNQINKNSNISNSYNKLKFPILSYQFIVLDYLSNGYYIEKEIYYSNDSKGKINWKQTIQKKKSYISNNSAIYLDFFVKKNIINENTMLTRIHEFCVYESFKKIGWLYTDFIPKKLSVKFNKSQFLTILNDAISATNNDNKKRVFTSMINIINAVNEGTGMTSSNSFGACSFEYVWEKMIDYIFGISNKEIYFPKATWSLINPSRNIKSSLLRPDTIIKKDNKIYIIDAKYYKYGITRNQLHLPASSSIEKQITYGEYILSDTFRDIVSDNIEVVYNAFIMPAKLNSKNYEFIGIATGDWKKSDKTYENVVGVLVDTKYLIDSCSRENNREIDRLSSLIEENIR